LTDERVKIQSPHECHWWYGPIPGCADCARNVVDNARVEAALEKLWPGSTKVFVDLRERRRHNA
jgi:hypothetical protein